MEMEGERKRLGLTSGWTMYIHSKRSSLSSTCADVLRERRDEAPYGVETASVVHREAGKCSFSAGNHPGLHNVVFRAFQVLVFSYCAGY